MIEISQRFSFDAAHHLGAGAAENRRLHGHSFYVEVTLRGEPDAKTGFLRDFGQVDAVLKQVRELLDHRLLNEVEGLDNPTLENHRPLHSRQGQGGAAGSRPGQDRAAVLWSDLHV